MYTYIYVYAYIIYMHTYVMECYSSLRDNRKLCYLQNMDECRGHYVDGNSQAQRDKYYMIQLICEIQKVELIEVKSRMLVTKGYK
jgi:hypothetical protein